MRLGVSPTATIPTGFFSQSIWGFISLHWNPGFQCLSHSPFVPPSLFIPKFVYTQFVSHHLTVSPLHPDCPSLPLLLVSMNASLTPLLLDFHTVRFPGSYGNILFSNLLFSFFWLCKEKNVSTYAFILSGRLIDVILDTFTTFTTATLLHLLHSVFFRNFPQIHHIHCLSLCSVILTK